MKIKFIKKTVTSLIVFTILSYFLITTKDLLTRIFIIPFLIFSIGMFTRNIFLILNKNKLVKIFNKVYVIAFLVYWFGFLIYFDYISILKKNFTLVFFSLIFYFIGLFFIYRRFRKK